MQMFMEALVHLNDCTRIFYEVKEENTQIEERLYKLENMVSGVDTVYDLRDEIGVLRTRVEMFQPTLNSLVGRIESVENKIGKLETNLGYLIQSLNNINVKNIGLDSRLASLEKIINDLTSGSDSDII
jgi:uncharacterized coiled-coil protein SlyX